MQQCRNGDNKLTYVGLAFGRCACGWAYGGRRNKMDMKLVCAPVNISNAHWVLVFVNLQAVSVSVSPQ